MSAGGRAPGRRAQAGPLRLGTVLEGVVRRRDWGPALRVHRAVALWPGVAGTPVCLHTRAVEVRDGVLWVEVESPTWAAQLGFLRTELLRRLRAECGPGLRNILFRIGASAGGYGAGEPPEGPGDANGALASAPDAPAVSVSAAFASWRRSAARRRARLETLRASERQRL